MVLTNWAGARQNLQIDLCAKWRLRSDWSESSLSTWRRFGSFATHNVHSEDWSDWADAQADLSLGIFAWRKGHFVGFVVLQLILRQNIWRTFKFAEA